MDPDRPGYGSEWHLYECGHNKASGRDPQWLPTTPLVLKSVRGRHSYDRPKAAVGNLEGKQ
jgi:hypothetical protein